MVPSRTGGVTPNETLMIYSSQEPGTERRVCGRRQGVPALSSEGWGAGGVPTCTCPHVFTHVGAQTHAHLLRALTSWAGTRCPHATWPARARTLASVILPSAAQERTAGGSGMGNHEVGVGEQENFLLPETPCDCAQPRRPHRRKAAAPGPGWDQDPAVGWPRQLGLAASGVTGLRRGSKRPSWVVRAPATVPLSPGLYGRAVSIGPSGTLLSAWGPQAEATAVGTRALPPCPETPHPPPSHGVTTWGGTAPRHGHPAARMHL